MNKQKIYQLIGLCQKARKLVSGEFSVKQAVLDQKAYLVIVTEDASDNTKKLFKDKSSYRSIPYVEWGTRDDLGRMLGKDQRVAIAILDEKLAEKIMEMIKNNA